MTNKQIYVIVIEIITNSFKIIKYLNGINYLNFIVIIFMLDIAAKYCILLHYT